MYPIYCYVTMVIVQQTITGLSLFLTSRLWTQLTLFSFHVMLPDVDDNWFLDCSLHLIIHIGKSSSIPSFGCWTAPQCRWDHWECLKCFMLLMVLKLINPQGDVTVMSAKCMYWCGSQYFSTPYLMLVELHSKDVNRNNTCNANVWHDDLYFCCFWCD